MKESCSIQIIHFCDKINKKSAKRCAYGQRKIDYLARLWIMEAAAKIKQSFKETLDIDVKSGRNDLVTNMDKETEAFFCSTN